LRGYLHEQTKKHLGFENPDRTADALHNLPPVVQECIMYLLKVALTCLDNVTYTNGTIQLLKTKIANFVANHFPRNWLLELYNMVDQMLWKTIIA
jgi:nuclear pore complex protein Nup93